MNQQELGIMSQEVQNMSEALNKYGVGIISTAIIYVLFMFVIMALFFYLKKMLADSQELTKDFINWLKKDAKGGAIDHLEESIKTNSVMLSHLKYLCAVGKCDRASVYMFHNGQYLLNGTHIMKFSCYLEFSILDRYACLSLQRDVPINQIQDLCESLINHNHIAIKDVGLEETPFREWCRRFNIKSIIIEPVYNKDGGILGFVSAEYHSGYIDDKDIASVSKRVRGLADKVSITLECEQNT